MRIFIENTMKLIYDDFLNSTKLMNNLHDLWDCTFKGGKIPDYSNINVQRLYLLRYLPAYFTEYYMIYNEILKNFPTDKGLKVLSIGCGSGIDYWSLKHATNNKIDYLGIDQLAWYYQPCDSEYNFQQMNVQDLVNLDFSDYNIIIFPKSLGEFCEEDINCLYDKLNSTKFNSSELCIISSNLKSNQNKDEEKLKHIVKGLEESGLYNWKSIHRLNFSNQSQGIKSYVKEFQHPLRDEVKEIQLLCRRDNCIEDCKIDCRINMNNEFCKKKLNREPILSPKLITDLVYIFKIL